MHYLRARNEQPLHYAPACNFRSSLCHRYSRDVRIEKKRAFRRELKVRGRKKGKREIKVKKRARTLVETLLKSPMYSKVGKRN